MIKRALRSFTKRSGSLKASVPDGVRVYAIGDVHGCSDQLNRLLDRIAHDVAGWTGKSQLIFLGDLIDRGPDSAGVLDRLARQPLPADQTNFIMGNHEETLLACYEGEVSKYALWLQHGGIETLESYGVPRSDIFSRSFDLAGVLQQTLPADHIELVRSCVDYLQSGSYVFVHAGVRPGVPLDQQRSRDLRWMAPGKTIGAEYSFTVVHGHSVVKRVESYVNRIAVDTGCYSGGPLSALVLEGEKARVMAVR